MFLRVKLNFLQIYSFFLIYASFCTNLFLSGDIFFSKIVWFCQLEQMQKKGILFSLEKKYVKNLHMCENCCTFAAAFEKSDF